MYKDSRAKVRAVAGLTDFFTIMKGAKQGDKISAIFFCLVIATVVTNIGDANENGVKIGERLLSYLTYSDDKTLIGCNRKNLQDYLDIFVSEAEKVGLIINMKKTKSMTVIDETQQFKINDHALKTADVFPYLGFYVSNQNSHEKGVSKRIVLAWEAYKNKSSVMNARGMPIQIKVKIYKVYIQPVYYMEWNV